MQFFLQKFVPDLKASIVFLNLYNMLELIPCLRCLYKLKPILTWHMVGISYNRNSIAAFEMIPQRHHLAVHLSPYTAITYLGMNCEREVYRCSPAYQFLNIAFWCKYIYNIREEVYLHRVHKLFAVGKVLLPLHHLSQPVVNVMVFGIYLAALLILPVSGDTFFCQFVHLIRPYLEFHPLPLRTYYSCVKRLIHIGFRNPDKIFKPPGHRRPHRVDHAKYCVAIDLRTGNNTDTGEVVNLLECDTLTIHFHINTVEVLGPAIYICIKSIHFKILFDNSNYVLYIFVSFSLVRGHLF